MLVIELMRSVNYENGKKGYTSKEKYPEAKKGQEGCLAGKCKAEKIWKPYEEG